MATGNHSVYCFNFSVMFSLLVTMPTCACLRLAVVVSGTSLYNRTRWKGRELKLQLARESFISR